jgi:hypothetical protein
LFGYCGRFGLTNADFNPDGAVSTGKRIKVWLRRVVPKAVL